MNCLIPILAATLALADFPYDWKDQADNRIESIRKGDFVITVLLPNSQPASTLPVHVRQMRHFFKFGTSLDSRYIGQNTDSSKKYENFITELFTSAVCEREMTWKYTERVENETDFSDADKLLAFAEKNHISMRGHCLLCGTEEKIQPWLQILTNNQLKQALTRRLSTIVPRYKNRLICWEVADEMLDNAYYTNTLDEKSRIYFFKKTRLLDPKVPLFTNEYGILEDDGKTINYIQLIRQLQKQGAEIGGIGIEDHTAERFAFRENDTDEKLNRVPLRPGHVLRRLDELAKLKLPIHISELSFKTDNEEKKAEALENCYRLLFSHPGVEGIYLWGFWEKDHWLGREAALVDNNWNLLPAAKVLRRLLLYEWNTMLDLTTTEKGKFYFRGFYGDYKISIDLPTGERLSSTVSLTPSSPMVKITLAPNAR